MLIKAQLRSKQEEIQPVRCDVACIVELSNAEFYDFQFNPLADHDFIKEHLPDLKTDEFHAIPCMLVLGDGGDDGLRSAGLRLCPLHRIYPDGTAALPE